jgi:hypothetical protein
MEPDTEVVTNLEETPIAVVSAPEAIVAPDAVLAASELAKAAALASQAAAARAALEALTKPKTASATTSNVPTSIALKEALSAATLESLKVKPAKHVEAKKPKAAPAAKKAKAPEEAPKEMTQAEAKAIINKYEGKRGRRPEAFHQAQKLLGIEPGVAVKPPKAAKVAKAVKAPKAAKAPKAEAEAKPMTQAAAKEYVKSFEGKKGRRPAAFYEAQKLLGIEPGEKAETPKATAALKAKAEALVGAPMTEAAANALIAKYAGKKGRRPAAFYEAQKLVGAAEPVKVKVAKAPKAVKAPKAAKVKPAAAEPMTEAAAKTLIAKYAGKKGRRPAAFHEAQKLLGIDPKAANVAKAGVAEKKAAKADKKAALKAAAIQAKADKKAAKLAKKTAKLEAVAAKKAARAEKKAAKLKAIADKKAAKTATTGQSGPPLKDLTAEDLNEKEVAVILALGTEGHRADKEISIMATECFPNKKKAQANSWIRNGLRRLVRAKLVEKTGKGLFKQTAEGRELAKKVEALQKK